jgi:hypothetical protein
MKLEIGYGDTIYGTVENVGDTLVYNGERKDSVQFQIESMNPPTQGMGTWLSQLPERLKGRVWARELEK